MKSQFQFFILFLVSHFFAFSQDQECIMYFNDGVAIEGFGMIKNDQIKFRLSKEEEGEFWNSEDVSKITFIGFEFNKTFEYSKIKQIKKPQLVELLVDGEVKLYRYYENTTFINFNTNSNAPNYNASISANRIVTLTPENNNLPIGNTFGEVKSEHYLKRKTEEIATCIDCSLIKSWAKNVSNYLADCDTLVRDLKNHQYSFAELEDVIIYYNDICVE